jgi:predicted PurR-regulated permease PerM
VLLVLIALFGAQVATQLTNVAQRIPDAIDSLGARLDIPNAAASAEEAIRAGTGGLVSRMARFGYTAIGGLANLLLVCVAAIYLAAAPALYVHGAAKLLPPSQHERFIDAMSATARALRLWVGGQLVSMTIVGVMSTFAYWLIGLPSPLGLGFIAALTDFIPFVGPILGAFLPVVFSLNIGTGALLWTLAAVITIQQIEGNVVMPLIQRRAVSMPPVVALFAIVAFGLVFGPLGVILAVPLAAAIIVLVKKLWIREALGEETELPGEK